MKIKVAELLKEPVGKSQEYEVGGSVDIIGDGKGSLVEGDVTLLRTSRGIMAAGSLNTEIKLACSRCLETFDYPITLNIKEEYIPTVDMATGAPLPLPEEPGTFTIDGRQFIDLTEAIVQYSLLAVPIKPLCREDCAGLCQTCGANLNLGDCGCPPQDIDPRWADLSRLTHK